jgi:hypothetical protein
MCEHGERSDGQWRSVKLSASCIVFVMRAVNSKRCSEVRTKDELMQGIK